MDFTYKDLPVKTENPEKFGKSIKSRRIQNNFRTNKSKVIMVLVIGDDDDDDGKTVWLDLLNLDQPSPNPHHHV